MIMIIIIIIILLLKPLLIGCMEILFLILAIGYNYFWPGLIALITSSSSSSPPPPPPPSDMIVVATDKWVLIISSHKLKQVSG
jgi:hypothetical protein